MLLSSLRSCILLLLDLLLLQPTQSSTGLGVKLHVHPVLLLDSSEPGSGSPFLKTKNMEHLADTV